MGEDEEEEGRSEDNAGESEAVKEVTRCPSLIQSRRAFKSYTRGLDITASFCIFIFFLRISQKSAARELQFSVPAEIHLAEGLHYIHGDWVFRGGGGGGAKRMAEGTRL